MRQVIENLYTPSALQDEAVRSYVRTDASLIHWQVGMSALYKQIVDTTPVGEISDSSMEFKFDGDSRRYMKREWPADPPCFTGIQNTFISL